MQAKVYTKLHSHGGGHHNAAVCRLRSVSTVGAMVGQTCRTWARRCGASSQIKDQRRCAWLDSQSEGFNHSSSSSLSSNKHESKSQRSAQSACGTLHVKSVTYPCRYVWPEHKPDSVGLRLQPPLNRVCRCCEYGRRACLVAHCSGVPAHAVAVTALAFQALAGRVRHPSQHQSCKDFLLF